MVLVEFSVLYIGVIGITSLLMTLTVYILCRWSLGPFPSGHTLSAHWTEKARWYWAMLRALHSTAMIIAVAGSVCAIAPFIFAHTDTSLLLYVISFAGFIAGRYGAIPVYYHFWRIITWSQNRSFTTYLQRLAFSELHILLSLFVYYTLLAALEWLMPQQIAIRLALSILIMIPLWCTGALMQLAYFILRINRSPPLELQQFMIEECEIQGVRHPKLWFINTEAPYAAALIYRRTILLTRGLSDILSSEQVRSVIAHEAAHLGEPLTMKVRRLVPMVFLIILVVVPYSVTQLVQSYTSEPAYILTGIAASLILISRISRLFTRELSRRLEHRADDAAIERQTDPSIYGLALEKMYERNLIPAVVRKQDATHPDLFDRLLKAGITPTYPRPRPPSQIPVRIALGTVAATAGIITAVITLTIGRIGHREEGNSCITPPPSRRDRHHELARYRASLKNVQSNGNSSPRNSDYD